MLGLPAIPDGLQKMWWVRNEEESSLFLCIWVAHCVDQVGRWLMNLNQTPIDRVAIKCSSKNLYECYIGILVHSATTITHTLSPQVSTVLKASQNGSYSISPDNSAHGNCA